MLFDYSPRHLFVLAGLLVLPIGATPILLEPAEEEKVTIVFEVVVPDETPPGDTVYWAGSLNHWDPGRRATGFSAKDFSLPASKASKNAWRVEVTAPRDAEESYKYARGSIFSVEEEAGHTYRPTRTATFDAPKTIRDTVEAWHDIPPDAIADRWPVLPLEPSDVQLTRDGEPVDRSGMILYDKEKGSRFLDLAVPHAKLKRVPKHFEDYVSYYARLAEAPPSYLIVLAARHRPDGPWTVYVDRDRDRTIAEDERVFSIEDESEDLGWRGMVPLTREMGSVSFIDRDSVEITIRHAPDRPVQRASSAHSGAPDLIYQYPYKHRTASLNGNAFNVSAPFPVRFTNYLMLTVDRDGNRSVDIGSGTNEMVAVNNTEMYREQTFFLHPTFELGDDTWEVASIDPAGTELRLRPAPDDDDPSVALERGAPIPEWEATTVDGTTLRKGSLEGKYVLLDFWGSWCAPCVEALPKLEEAYDRFAGDEFELVGFASENNEESLERALDAFDISWPQVLDDEGTYSTKFQVRGYPTYYLVDPEGTVVAMGDELRGDRLIPTLKKYLEE